MTRPYSIVSSTSALSIWILSSRGALGRSYNPGCTSGSCTMRCVCPGRPQRGSTIGDGGDSTILSPRRSSKQPLPGMRLHDPLHGRQACPKFIASDQGVGQICPREGLFLCRSLSKQGQICYIPPPLSQSLNLSSIDRSALWLAFPPRYTNSFVWSYT